MITVVFMSANLFLYRMEDKACLCYCFFLFLFSTPIMVPLCGRDLHRCLNFTGVGIGLLLWEVGGLGLPFSCVPPLCSLSDHFLLLSVHKYKKKKKYICINF